MNWINRELDKCESLFEKLDLRDIERNAVRNYYDSLKGNGGEVKNG